MPEIDSGEHLVRFAGSCGYCSWGNDTPVPLSFVEIEAWSKITRQEVSGFEAELIQKLSQHYCSSYIKSMNPGCPDPCIEDAVEQNALESFRNLVERYKK